jgi:hypothetical protein
MKLLPAPLRSAPKSAVALVAIASIGLVAVGCSESKSDQSSLACDHFRNVAYDAGHGLLTIPELRNKVKEVYDDAIIATPEVQVAARNMLASVTSGDLSASDVTALGNACAAAGH